MGSGRFNTPDPSTGSSAADPGSWNKYLYVGGDPVNFNDPGGDRRYCVATYEGEACFDIPDLPGDTDNQQGGQTPAKPVKADPTREAAGIGNNPGGVRSILQGLFLDPALAGSLRLLQNSDCKGLFDTLAMDSNFGTTDPSQILNGADNHNQIAFYAFGDNIGPGVMAQTTGPNGTIQIAANRAFVTGVLASGASVTTAVGLQGLSLSEINEVFLIHELLHFTGSVGADSANQEITLANGDVVNGSAGVTAEVRQNCIHH